jgi:signal transduction histidine kinase
MPSHLLPRAAAFRGRIRHRRIRGAARALLGVRLLEGAAVWAILIGFYAGHTVAPWAVHLTFLAYIVGNLHLFRRHRAGEMTAPDVGSDIAINLIPMTLAAFWSGGIYSPFIAVFVVKITTYTQFFGTATGWLGLFASIVSVLALVALMYAGIPADAALAGVRAATQRDLTLTFQLLAYGIIIGAGLKLFHILHDRERSLARQQEQLRRLTRGMMGVAERTMSRVARDLHDDLGQALTAVKMDLGLVERQLDDGDGLRTRVREARDQIGTVLRNVRDLSQLLRPAVLDDLGLVAAIRSYITRFSERNGTLVELEAPAAGRRLPRPLEVTLYRVVQEGLTNVARHAGAQRVQIRLEIQDAAELQIIDDGCGFDSLTYLRNPPPGHGMGVLGMRERVVSYGGRFDIESRAGHGTQVRLSIPLRDTAEEPEDEHAEDSRLAH